MLNELRLIWLGGGKGYFRHSSKLFYIKGIGVGQPPIFYHFWVCWWTLFPEKLRPLRLEVAEICWGCWKQPQAHKKCCKNKKLVFLTPAGSQTCGLSRNTKSASKFQPRLHVSSASKKWHTYMTASEYFFKQMPFLWYEINIKSSISWKFKVDEPRGYRNTRSASPWCLPLVIL